MTQRRILLKLSGQSLCEEDGFGIDSATVLGLAEQIRTGLRAAEVELALVFGGGNFLRGKELAKQGIDRPTGDSMGMLATIMNALAMQAALESLEVKTRVLSAIEVKDMAETFDRRRCVRHLEEGRVVILAGGTGHPFFTTDTTAALRALQIGADWVYKGTKVKGVYSANPDEYPDAKFYETLSFQEALEKRLAVMDSTAFGLCMDNQLPIHVFSMKKKGNVEKALQGEHLGTLVR